MKVELKDTKHFLKIVKNKSDGQLDVFIDTNSKLAKNYRVDLELVAFTNSENMNSEEYSISPFEEFSKSIRLSKNTGFKKINGSIDKLFGVLVSLSLLTLFLIIKRGQELSTEEIVPILGIYFIAKDLWNDFENGIVFITRNLPVKFLDKPFQYIRTSVRFDNHLISQLRSSETLKEFVEPFKFSYVENPDSKSIKMMYTQGELKDLDKGMSLVAQIKSESNLDDLSILTKISVMKKKFLVFNYEDEYYQVYKKDKVGYQKNKMRWLPQTASLYKTFNFSRLKKVYDKKLVRIEQIKSLRG